MKDLLVVLGGGSQKSLPSGCLKDSSNPFIWGLPVGKMVHIWKLYKTTATIDSIKSFKCQEYPISIFWSSPSFGSHLGWVGREERKWGLPVTVSTNVLEFRPSFHSCPLSCLSLQTGVLNPLLLLILQPHLCVFLAFTSSAPMNQLTFRNLFPVSQSKVSKLLLISWETSLSTHGFFWSSCLFYLSASPPLFFTTPSNTMRRSRGKPFGLGEWWNEHCCIYWSSQPGVWQLPLQRFVFIDLAPHLLFIQFFQFTLNAHWHTCWSFVFHFPSPAIFHQLCCKSTCFHRRPSLKWLNIEHLFFQPSVKREPQFLIQVFNMSFEHIKLCN